MNRRRFAVLLAAAPILAGCHSGQKPAAASTLQIDRAVQDALKALDAAINDLDREVDDFRAGKDWSVVVPKVESSATDVRDAFDKLRYLLAVPNY